MNRATAFAGDTAVPLVGIVSMDTATFDVTEAPQAVAGGQVFRHHHQLRRIFIIQQNIHRQIKADGARPNIGRIMVNVAIPGERPFQPLRLFLRFRLRSIGRKRQADQQLRAIR